MLKYQPQLIEPKWQKKWAESELYKTREDPKKEKKYILDMFPYPSGVGLSVGHFKGYTATDVISRYFRLKGLNVLYPMGWDAFGLPAENYAIKTGVHPKITTANNIANIKRQMQMVGISYDWSREINTTDPSYYKWTQWIFLKLFEHGLAYEDEAPINWCPKDKTGLANEEVVNGKCERCGTPVEKKLVRQWILRITKYADRLLEDLQGLDWPRSIMDLQVNWIGRKEGINITYQVEGSSEKIVCFTTRPDTNFGATFIVIGPEHPLIHKVTKNEYSDAVKKYIEKVINHSEEERIAQGRAKTGVFTGSYAINNLNGKKLPIWVSDFVLGNVGTGAVVGVPGHDQRDFEFAKEFGLPIVRVVIGKNRDTSKITKLEQVQEKDGIMVNSEFLDGLDIHEAIKVVMDYLEEKGWGKRVVSYHLRDWLFSRQRYWGEPIPLIHCEKCGVVPVPEEQLPLELPDIENYQPTGTGESPLAVLTDWVNTTCPKCGGPGKRETNTMPQWAGSCWYYMRFCDPHNDSSLIRKDIEKYWLPVDWYVGGAEHAVLHLLYARFWHKFLFDIGIVSSKEPFLKLRNVGLILAPDGTKMSKSKGNIVSPDEIVKEYGADTLRVYEGFMGPFDDAISWNPTSINGVYRFLSRVWEVVLKEDPKVKDKDIDPLIYRMIEKVGNDIEGMKFNTAIAAMMEFVNQIYHKNLSLDQKEKFVIAIAPFAPHMAEELWSHLAKRSLRPSGLKASRDESWSVHQQSWPEVDNKYLEDEEKVIVVQVNGKVRSQIKISNDLVSKEKDIEKVVMQDPRVKKFMGGKSMKKFIYVPGKIFNLLTE